MNLKAYIVALHAALFSILLAVSPAGSGCMGLMGAGKCGGGAPAVTIALDGVGSFSESSAATTITSTLTTSNGSGIAVFFCESNAVSGVASVTSPNLTWTKQSATSDGSNNVIEEWTAPYSSNLSSEVITATTQFAGLPAAAMSFGVSGVHAASPFDTGTRPVASITSTNASITTSNAPDFVFGLLNSQAALSGAGSGWTVINQGGTLVYKLVAVYKIASSAGTFTPTQSSGTTASSIADAIQQGP